VLQPDAKIVAAERSVLTAILFDAAGTLFRVRGSVGLAYATIAAGHGVIVDPEDIERRFRAAFSTMPPLCFPGIPDAEIAPREQSWWKQIVAAAFEESQFNDFDAFFQDLFEHFAHAGSWELFPDTVPALAALRRRGLQLGVVSNFDSRLTTICNGLGIADFFDTLVISGRAGCAKPDPRIFAIALQRLGVPPAEAMHVGDSECHDLNGAQAAGLRAVLLQRGAARPSLAATIRDLRELLSLLAV
jgi:putative hydrolase of the HAD superfamily